MVEPSVEDKRITLEEAVGKINDGSHLFWGGFGYQRPPAAFARELVRQKKRNLTLYTCGSEIDIDILAGAGVATRFELAFVAIEALGLAPNFNRRTCEGKILIEDYSNLGMAMRFLGGALGVPFMPVKSMMGTDIVRLYKFRKDKVKVIPSPFDGEPVCLVPSVRPDFSIVHVQRVDPEGNAQIDGIVGEDGEGSRAGKKLIVLAEEIVASDVTRSQPDRTIIPGVYVTHVVECKWGSHPMSVYGCYDYDLEHLQHYQQLCKTEEGWNQYLEEWVMGTTNESYLEKVGVSRLLRLQARKGLGY